MTDEEYIACSQNCHERLLIIRDQLDNHARNSHPSVGGGVVQPLRDAQQRIINEIIDLEAEYWGP